MISRDRELSEIKVAGVLGMLGMCGAVRLSAVGGLDMAILHLLPPISKSTVRCPDIHDAERMKRVSMHLIISAIRWEQSRLVHRTSINRSYLDAFSTNHCAVDHTISKQRIFKSQITTL